MGSRRSRSLALVRLLGLLALPASAGQFVVTEVTYTHSPATTTDSHYRVAPAGGTPSNWVTPVDFSHGTAVVRLEVFTKPSAVPTRFQICFEATPSYACTDQAPAYTSPGVYTWTTSFTNFYQYAQVDWSKGVRTVALILKDTNNVKPAPENVGATVSALYMPTDVRVTVTIVSPGGTYVPPDAGVDAGAVDAGTVADAGASDAGVANDAGASFDAGVEPDAGAGAGPVTGGCSSVTGSVGLACWVLGLRLARRGSRGGSSPRTAAIAACRPLAAAPGFAHPECRPRPPV
jgi:hypothetical protein